MKRMTARERTLLIIVVILMVGALYYLLFYSPTTKKLDSLETEKLNVQDDISAADLQLDQMHAMQAEIDAIFAAADGEPTELAAFDNSTSLMNELNTVLAGVSSVNLNFDATAADGNIVRRSISMQFSCASYEKARAILQDISDSEFRNIINNISVSMGDSDKADSVSISAKLVYFEYDE